MIGEIIGGVVSAAGSIFGGMKASEAMRGVKGRIEEQRRSNRAWYERRANEDATQRADAQRVLAKTEEAVMNRNRALAGSSAVMGGTVEGEMAARAANSEALAEAASRIAASADDRRDRIDEQYRGMENSSVAQLNQMDVNKANAIVEATKGVSQFGSSLAGIDKK